MGWGILPKVILALLMVCRTITLLKIISHDSMSNLSYCRFQNTANDLQDCEDYIFDNDLSKNEHNARIRLIAMCKSIAHDFEDSDGSELLDDNEQDDD